MKKRKADSKEYEITRLSEQARYLLTRDPLKTQELFQQAIALARQHRFTGMLINTLIEAGRSCMVMKEYKQALIYFTEASGLSESVKDTSGLIQSLEGLSEVHFLTANYESAITHRLLILKAATESGSQPLIAEAHNKLGDIYKYHTNYAKALEHHRKALQIYEELNDTTQLSFTHFNIGNCLNWINELPLARIHLSKALELAESVGNPQLKAKPLGSLAILLTKEKDFVNALDNFHKSINLANMFADTELLVNLKKSLGKLYHELGQFDKAIDVLLQALDSCQSLPTVYPSNIIHGFLSEVFEKVGDYENALIHHKQYLELCKKINNEQITLKITELELRSEIENARREKMLAEQSSRIKDRFISGISHELRTPLNGIFGMIELLEQTHLTPEQNDYLKTIRFSSNSLLHIINDLLDYSYINQGTFSLHQSEFRLKDTAAEVVAEHLARATDKKIQMVLSLDENLPLTVIGDRQRLIQILNNLISNAIKFTDKGKVTVSISLLEKRNGKACIQFAIADTGCGIRTEWIPHIFESYAFPELLRHPNSGSGLGLTIVKSLIEKQHGKISVTSKEGKGTEFRFQLDYGLKTETPSSASPAETILVEKEKMIDVLLVEDNKVNQFLGKQLLSRLNCQVDLATNADDAIKKLSSKKFDLILMDVQLPGMNGYELTKHIREKFDKPACLTPIVALTAYASDHERENAFKAGMNDYITKPYSPADLVAVIKKFTPAMLEQSKSEALDALLKRMGGNRTDACSLAEMILQQVPALVQKMEKASKEQKWKSVAELAHKLKSTIGLLEIPDLSQSISTIEQHALNLLSLEQLPERIATFSKKISDCLKQLEHSLLVLKSAEEKNQN